MMKRLLIITVLLFGALVAFGQRDVSDKENEAAPKTALIEAQKDYQKAIKEKNSLLLIQSLIRQIKYQSLIDMDSIPPMLQNLEEYIETDQNIVEKSILHSLLAELYQMYFDTQRGKINRRTPITGYIPRNMAEWTGNIYREKIFQHALDAVKAQAQLSEVNCLTYKEILILGKNSPALRPTMYDFLVYRSIDILNTISRYDRQELLTNKQLLFAPVKEFVQMPIEVKKMDAYSNTLKLYQSLLQSEIAAQRTDAILISDLDRLEYANNIIGLSLNDSLYIQALEQLSQQYSKNPYKVEILYKLAQYYYQGNYISSNRDTQKALDICNSGIRQFPKYFRIDILKQLAKEITQTTLSYSINPNVYPGHKQEVNLSFKNLSEISISLYKITEPTLEYLNLNKRVPKLEKISTHTYRLPKRLDSQDTILRLPVPNTGRYQLTVSYANNSKADSSYFSSSHLSTIARKTGETTYNVLVCDLISGKPIEGAKVKIYKRNGQKYSLAREFSSDRNGIATLNESNPDNYYQVTLGEDNHGTINRLPYQYFGRTDERSSSVNLFTDRAIYRPGQIVYFSGISWEATQNASKAIVGKNYTVTLQDVNQQVIAEQEVRTNKFGSFAGKFTLPKEVLNGMFIISTDGGSQMITVAEYKRPKFEITFTPLKDAYKLGDRLTVSGIAKTYSGVNIENSKVTYTVQTRTFDWSLQENTIATGKTQTNAKGEFEISFQTKESPNTPTIYRGFETYTVSVTITTSNGETQEAQYPIIITNQRYQLNSLITPEINKDLPSKILVTTQNQLGYPLTENITYELFFLKPLQKLGEQYDEGNPPIDKKVREGTFTTGEDKKLEMNLSSLPSGAYLLKFAGTGNDKDITYQRIVYLYSTQDERPPYPTYYWCVQEKTVCAPGEDAKILIGSSAKEVYVLYEVYSNQKFMERKRFMLNNSNTTLSIPYKETYGPTADVFISYIKDNKFFLENITLTRKETSKQLDITTKTFRDHLTPGQQEEWSFVVKTEQGKAAIAEMMASMYDASLDKIHSHRWNFNPVYSTYSMPPRWRYTTYPLNGYLSERIKWANVPRFEYDVLNLYGLNQFGFSNEAQIMVRGYDGVPGALAEESTTEDVAVVAFGKVAGVSNLSNSDTRFYLRGLSSFKESGDEAFVAGELASPEIRQNFQETAFFFPQLLTDSTGNVVIKFTVPESNTTWKFMALAHTPTMQFGQIEKFVVTSKKFMVNTNLPRFVRTGDKVVLQTTINNLTPEEQQGEAYLELFVPSTNAVVSKQQVAFNVKAEENQTISFEFTAPKNMDLLGCRIVASSSEFSDGEQHVLPVVPDATLVTQTLPIFTHQQGQQTFKLNAPKGFTPYRLTLELTANPIWYAVLALPTINTPQTDNVTEITASYYVSTLATAIANANPQITNTIQQWMQKPDAALTSPLEKNQELKSILLQLSPWVTEAQNETQQMRSLGELLDVNRQNYISQQAINKLAELQNEDGGWSWFKGFTSSTFMTENVLEAMARLVTLNITSHPEQVKKMQIKALQFLDKQIQESYKHVKTAGYSQILYLYTRSAYRDIPLTNALEAHKYYLNQLETSWTQLSLYEKALTAIAMERYGKTDIAKQIIRSLKEYSTITPEMGMYWANNRSSLFTNSAIQTHVAVMSAFREIEGNSTDTELMKQWLLRQKQTQSWGSTPTTVDAVYALLLTGNNQLASPEDLSVKLGNKNLNISPEETTLGYIKQTFTGKKITPKMMNVTLSKKRQQASWGGLYLQYFEKLDNITSHSGGISVKKDLFIQKEGDNGNTLTPLTGQNLQVGDRICIRITVTNDQDMQFVHLKDLRAGCFEPTEQLSGNRWQDNLGYYQETTDVATNFFFDFLPKGTHVFEYTVWIAQRGTYQDGIATLQCVYAPQYSANSDAGSVTIQ